MKLIIIILVILIVLIILLYNDLIKSKLRCQNAFSSIDNQLKRRFDLLPNLIEVTKGYAKHERETLAEIINARNTNQNIESKANESEKISKNVTKLLALSESYPELKSNELFKNLQIELVGTEDKIAFARQYYNDCVERFNTKIKIFPNNLVASTLKYKEYEYFKASDKEKEIVKVEL